MQDLEKLMKLQQDYKRGLNYIENTNKNSSLRSMYIDRLKELKEEIQTLTLKSATPKQRGR